LPFHYDCVVCTLLSPRSAHLRDRHSFPTRRSSDLDGLGAKQFFDAKRLVNGELTLAEGAIRGWDRRNVYYFQMLGSLASHYGFSLDEPFDSLPEKHQQCILRGSGKESVDFRYLNDRGDIVKRSHPFEGIIPNLERRYRETESNSVREELAKYLSTQPCPECRGTRLRR